MPVYRTDKWIEKSYRSPKYIYKKLTKFFHEGNVKDITNLLIHHGMYHKPENDGELLLESLRKKNVWEIIEKEEIKLKREWNGQNVSIFILPSDSYNRKIREHYNGRSGLAFPDKLFIFLSSESTVEEIKALFTHEYNHCCRLIHDPTKEKDYTLLNRIILEGLAENAVRERFGTSPLAPWTTYYTNEELQDLWEQVVLPHKDLSKNTRNASAILYGKSFYPNMVGYAVGYYLVKHYMKQTGKRSKDLLKLPAEKIAFIDE